MIAALYATERERCMKATSQAWNVFIVFELPHPAFCQNLEQNICCHHARNSTVCKNAKWPQKNTFGICTFLCFVCEFTVIMSKKCLKCRTFSISHVVVCKSPYQRDDDNLCRLKIQFGFWRNPRWDFHANFMHWTMFFVSCLGSFHLVQTTFACGIVFIRAKARSCA